MVWQNQSERDPHRAASESKREASGSRHSSGPGARTLESDLAQARKKMGKAGRQIGEFVKKGIEEEPFAVVAVASGIGFVLGGGVTRNALTLALGVAGRAAGAWLIDAHGDAQDPEISRRRSKQ